jgi:hypothetical protein
MPRREERPGNRFLVGEAGLGQRAQRRQERFVRRLRQDRRRQCDDEQQRHEPLLPA